MWPRIAVSPGLAAMALFLLGLTPCVAEAGENPALAFEIVEAAVPHSLDSGQKTRIPVTVRNTGIRAWKGDQGFSLSYHWLDAAGKVVVWDGRRTHFEQTVPPSARVTLQALVQTPAKPGVYGLQWDIVQEHVCWISRRMGRAPPVTTVTVRARPPDHAFTVLEHGPVPRMLVGGDRFDLRVLLRNDGTLTWRSDEPFNVSYHWSGSTEGRSVFEGVRTRIPRTVPPGGQVEVDLELRAPLWLGPARLQIDMVHEGVVWFSQRDPTPAPQWTIFLVVNPLRSPVMPFAVAILALGVMLAARRTDNVTLLTAAAMADLVWLFLSLTGKQWAVLVAADRNPLPGCGWVAASGVALMALVLLALPQRWRPWLSWAVVALASFVILSDVVYLRYFHDVISVESLSAGHQVGDIRKSIAALLRWGDLWLGADLLPGFFLALTASRLKARRRRLWQAVLALLLAALMLPGALTGWRVARSKKGVFVQVFQSVFIVQQLGVLNYHLFDIWRNLEENVFRPPLGEEGYEEVLRFFTDRRPLRRGSGRFFGVARGKNLLMIQVESLQGWVPGLVIDGQRVTPNLDRLAPACLSFKRCTDQTNMGRTSDGEITTQTSLLPALHGVAAFTHGANHWVGLAGVLRDHGYATLSAVPFQPAFWNRRILHPAFGFDTNLYASDFGPGERIGWGLNDRDFLLQLAERIAALPEPFCAWGITAMADRLGQLGLLGRTVVVLWGDHDSGLVWSPEVARALGFPHTMAGWYMADRVPLIVHVPGSAGPHGVSSTVAGQTDVAPTVAALLGVDPAAQPWLGRNLLGNPGPGPVPRPNGGWLSDRFLYVSRGPELSDGMCFDAASLKKLPVEECARDDAAARREVKVADTVLRYDLQRRLAEDLARSSSSAASPAP